MFLDNEAKKEFRRWMIGFCIMLLLINGVMSYNETRRIQAIDMLGEIFKSYDNVNKIVISDINNNIFTVEYNDADFYKIKQAIDPREIVGEDITNNFVSSSTKADIIAYYQQDGYDIFRMYIYLNIQEEWFELVRDEDISLQDFVIVSLFNKYHGRVYRSYLVRSVHIKKIIYVLNG